MRATISSSEMELNLLVIVFETAVLCSICFVALIGNLSLFVVVYRNRNLQTVTNLFILNLAAADVLVSVLSMPITMVTIIKERWVFGHTACVALGFFSILSFIASVMSLGMIAINRYFYIVRWNTYTKTFSKKKALLYAAGVWVVSISLSSPPLFGWAEFRFIPGKSYCFVYWPSNVHFMYFMISCCFFGPLLAMLFSYYNILTFTRASKRRVEFSRNNIASPKPLDQSEPETAPSNETHNNKIPGTKQDFEVLKETQMNRRSVSEVLFKLKSRISPEESKITNTFIIVVILFVICWGPFAATMFFDVYYPKPLPGVVEMISLLLGYLNSMCNPILYGLRNSAFKQGFRDLYSRLIPKRFTPAKCTQQEIIQMNAVSVPSPIKLEAVNVVPISE